MLDLFHVTDGLALQQMTPRPSPPGTDREGQLLVWAIDGDHLPNYLLPRDCPRVCWPVDETASGIMASPALRVIAIEQKWLMRSIDADLLVHRLAPENFTLVDAAAGYWISEQTARVEGVERVHDCPAELTQRGIELRVTGSRWPYIDEVGRHEGEFSIIRAGNAVPRSN